MSTFIDHRDWPTPGWASEHPLQAGSAEFRLGMTAVAVTQMQEDMFCDISPCDKDTLLCPLNFVDGG